MFRKNKENLKDEIWNEILALDEVNDREIKETRVIIKKLADELGFAVNFDKGEVKRTSKIL